MRLGWKRLLPLTLAGFVANAVFVFVSQMISIFLNFFSFCI
jgi:NADH:ubiquinone oxidoreductase subunit H